MGYTVKAEGKQSQETRQGYNTDRTLFVQILSIKRGKERMVRLGFGLWVCVVVGWGGQAVANTEAIVVDAGEWVPHPVGSEGKEYA